VLLDRAAFDGEQIPSASVEVKCRSRTSRSQVVLERVRQSIATLAKKYGNAGLTFQGRTRRISDREDTDE